MCGSTTPPAPRSPRLLPNRLSVPSPRCTQPRHLRYHTIGQHLHRRCPSRLLAGSAVLLKGDEYGTFAPGDMKMISYVPTSRARSSSLVAPGCSATVLWWTRPSMPGCSQIAHHYNGNVDPGSNQFRLPDASRVPVGFGTFALLGTMKG